MSASQGTPTWTKPPSDPRKKQIPEDSGHSPPKVLKSRHSPPRRLFVDSGHSPLTNGSKSRRVRKNWEPPGRSPPEAPRPGPPAPLSRLKGDTPHGSQDPRVADKTKMGMGPQKTKAPGIGPRGFSLLVAHVSGQPRFGVAAFLTRQVNVSWVASNSLGSDEVDVLETPNHGIWKRVFSRASFQFHEANPNLSRKPTKKFP